VLETMSGICVDEAALALPLINQQVTGKYLAAHSNWGPEIRAALTRFAEEIVK